MVEKSNNSNNGGGIGRGGGGGSGLGVGGLGSGVIGSHLTLILTTTITLSQYSSLHPILSLTYQTKLHNPPSGDGTGSGVGSGVGGPVMAGLDLDMELLDILSRVRLETLASRMGSGDERAGTQQWWDTHTPLSI